MKLNQNVGQSLRSCWEANLRKEESVPAPVLVIEGPCPLFFYYRIHYFRILYGIECEKTAASTDSLQLHYNMTLVILASSPQKGCLASSHPPMSRLSVQWWHRVCHMVWYSTFGFVHKILASVWAKYINLYDMLAAVGQQSREPSAVIRHALNGSILRYY